MIRDLFFLAMAMFMVGCSSFIIAGLLPEIGQTIKQPIAVAGQGITFFSLAYLVSAPLFSLFSSNLAVRKSIGLALSILVLGNLLTLLSDEIFTFLMARIFAGIGAGILTPMCLTFAVSIVNSQYKGRVLSFLWAANSAGVVFGVPMGLYFSSRYRWQVSLMFLIFLGGIALVGFCLRRNSKVDFKLPVLSLRESVSVLAEKNILWIISITCVTSCASLGLHSYITVIQSGTTHSLTLALFLWGLGGFVGSFFVGFFVDLRQKPQTVMAILIMGLFLAIIAIPPTRDLPNLGLIPFFLWGALGWATTTPQQHTLLTLRNKQGNILIALNSSAIGLGGALGTVAGGVLITLGINEQLLPFLAAMLLFVVFFWQLILIKSLHREMVREKASHHC